MLILALPRLPVKDGSSAREDDARVSHDLARAGSVDEFSTFTQRVTKNNEISTTIDRQTDRQTDIHTDRQTGTFLISDPCKQNCASYLHVKYRWLGILHKINIFSSVENYFEVLISVKICGVFLLLQSSELRAQNIFCKMSTLGNNTVSETCAKCLKPPRNGYPLKECNDYKIKQHSICHIKTSAGNKSTIILCEEYKRKRDREREKDRTSRSRINNKSVSTAALSKQTRTSITYKSPATTSNKSVYRVTSQQAG